MFRYFVNVWRQNGQRTRRVLAGAWITGAILQVVGVAGDFLGISDRYPFATNSLSNFTWACFAVPFAILVLQEYTRHQELQKQRQKILDDARSAVSSLAISGQKLQASLLPCHVNKRQFLKAQTRDAIALMESYSGEPLGDWVNINGRQLLGHVYIVIHGWNYWLGVHADVKSSLQEFWALGAHLNEHTQARLYDGFNIVWPLMENLARFQKATDRLLEQLCRGKKPSSDEGKTSSLAQKLTHTYTALEDMLTYVTIDPSFAEKVLDDMYRGLQQSEKDYQVREELHDAVGRLVGQCEDLADRLPLYPATSATLRPLNT